MLLIICTILCVQFVAASREGDLYNTKNDACHCTVSHVISTTGLQYPPVTAQAAPAVAKTNYDSDLLRSVSALTNRITIIYIPNTLQKAFLGQRPIYQRLQIGFTQCRRSQGRGLVGCFCSASMLPLHFLFVC
jgi:hypothetical protein